MIPLSDEALTTFAMLTAGLEPGQSVTYEFDTDYPLTVSRPERSHVTFTERDSDSGGIDSEMTFLWHREAWYAVTWVSEEWDAREEAVRDYRLIMPNTLRCGCDSLPQPVIN